MKNGARGELGQSETTVKNNNQPDTSTRFSLRLRPIRVTEGNKAVLILYALSRPNTKSMMKIENKKS